MRSADVLTQVTTPLMGSAYPVGPYRFARREYLNITYRTDPEAMRAVVPEPLEVGEPLVRFEVIRMPDTTGLGDYTESGQVLRVSLDGQPADYIHCMYLDNAPAIAVGREAGAYPKKLGSPKLYTDSDTIVGTLDYGSLRVATATMGYKHHPLDHAGAHAEITAPTYMLKIVPGYDGTPRICELIRAEITEIEILGAWSGPARLQLFEHAMAPLADLPVRQIVSASHILTNLTLPTPKPVHDYLTQ
ncbi:acetoacetate decarboxylase [Streptomyces sp. NPDC003996]